MFDVPGHTPKRHSIVRQFLILTVATGTLIWAAFALVAWQIHGLERSELERVSRQRVELINALARACRRYCSEELRPALKRRGIDFMIEGSSSTYLTKRILDYFTEDFPLYRHRQAADNPLNPEHRPSPFEQRLINRFRTKPGVQELRGITTVEGKRSFYVARPIVVEDRCLRCHGSPTDCPPEILERYGTDSGFGWKPGEIAGVVTVSVPVGDVLAGHKKMRRAVYFTVGSTAVSLTLAVAVLFGLLVLANRRNEELQEQRVRAEAANQAKTAFLATMSHEMRTPLNAILGYAEELAASAAQEPISPAVRESLRAIIVAGQHLRSLISDILDLARIESGRVQPQPEEFGLVELVAEVISVMRGRATGKGLSLQLRVQGSVPTRIVADAARMRQILVNLIGNAVKFTDQGGVTVFLGAERLAEPNRCLVRFRVTDTGPGIDPDRIPELFQPFVQLSSNPQHRLNGTGLGLAVTKSLIEAMGGTIDVESSPGKGTSFMVTLPCTLSQRCTWGDETLFAGTRGTHESKCRDEEPPLKGIQVLVCEDNPLNAKLVRRILERWGASVVVVSNGKEAVEHFSRTPREQWPAVVLMDLQMPVMDGVEAVRRLRENGVHVPVIALTANVMKDEYARCAAAGFDDYVGKPIDRDRLKATILRHTQAYRGSPSLATP